MGYHTSNGVFVDAVDIVAFGEQTISSATTINGPTIEVGEKTTALLDLSCPSLTASDTVEAKVQTSKDGTTWRDVASFATLNANGSERKSFPGLDRFMRAVVTTTDGGGGITAVVSISGELK